MTAEDLHWLELSSPPSLSSPKSAPTDQPPCLTCGWPVPPKAKVCPHCGYNPQLPAAQNSKTGDLLRKLGVDLLPPEIEIAPPPENWFGAHGFDSPTLYQLRLQAERFKITTGFDRLICLDDISVDHYQHQLEAALRALRDMRGRALLADEVGLGKTIEAGLVMKELIERGLVRRVLILTPASLTRQWQEELETKFYEQFEILERLEQLPAALEGEAPCRWIISLPRAKAASWAERLLARDYDLLIVDEAHKLKNHQTTAYKFVEQIRKQYVLMLTATPVHNHLLELYNLINILRPGQLGTRRAFRQNFVGRPAEADRPPAVPRRAARRTIYSHRSTPASAYLQKSAEARQVYRQGVEQSRWIWQRTERLADLDTLEHLDRPGHSALAEVQQLIAAGYEVVDFEAVTYTASGLFRSRPRLEFVCRLTLKAQPDQKRRRRPAARPEPRNPAALRQILREVMVRHRRSSVGLRFPPRRAAVYALNLTPDERRLYEGLTAYIREQLQFAKTRAEAMGPLKMTLMTLQKQLCSSPQAVNRSLKRLIAQQAEPDPRLVEYFTLSLNIYQGRKVEATLQLLNEFPGKFLIFTDYLPTLQALQEALDEAGIEAVTFHGGLSSLDRVEMVRRFRGPARVMISSQSGSEGHNLQFCHQLINFDLPWNPMRIEQRVGRLHRLGQPEAVSIFNLAANDTIEAYVLDLLARKIRMFELVIGELDLILGQLAETDSFEQSVEKAWAESGSEAELRRMMAELGLLLDQAGETYQEIRSVSDSLSDLLEAYDEVQAAR